MPDETITTMSDPEYGDISIGYAEPEVPESSPEPEAPPPAPATEAPVAAAEPPATPTAPEPPKQIVIDKSKGLREEIRRLEREDPEFANQYNIHVGDKAARKYKPIIDSLTAERDAARNELRRREMLAIPDAEKARLFETDPKWAKEYAELVHTKPEDTINNLRVQQERDSVTQRIVDTFRSAIDRGLPREQVDAVAADVQAGKFDHDEDGNVLHPLVALANIQQVFTDRLLAHARTAVVNTPAAASPAPVSEEPVAPPTNPLLTQPGPDTSTAGVMRASGHRDPLVDYQKALDGKGSKMPSSEEIDKMTARYLTME